MMKYFKLGALSLMDRLKTNLIIILQLTVIFVVVNAAVGSVNSRQMLCEPYKELYNKQGWYIKVMDRSVDARQLMTNCEIKPDYVVIYETDGNDNAGQYYRIAIMPDDLFADLHLPVLQTSSGVDRVYMYSPLAHFSAGDKVSLRIANDQVLNITLTDILTEPTYYPKGSSFSAAGDVTMLYRQLSSQTEKNNYLIMSETTAKSVGIPDDSVFAADSIILYYSEDISEEQFMAEEGHLSESGKTSLIRLSTLREQTEKMLSDDYKRYIPLGIISAIVVLIGTAGAIAIQTLREMKSYAVLYLCGMKWHRIIYISLFKVIIMLAAAGTISGTAIFVLQTSSTAAKLGMVFNSINLYASLALAALTLFSSILLPFILLRKASPADTMRRIKND